VCEAGTYTLIIRLIDRQTDRQTDR
jgi:hypothetical protein